MTHLENTRDLAYTYFVPSEPIRSEEFLVGRERELFKTLEALKSRGRCPFIFGERGVGKTSLAQTAAHIFNDTSVPPILVGCHRKISFADIILDIVKQLLASPAGGVVRKKIHEWKIGNSSVGHILKRVEESPDVQIRSFSPSLAVNLLNEACPDGLRGKVVAVIDELDVCSDETKADVAYLLKQAADQECAVRLMFAGIGSGVESLLRQHESASRYLATIRLERLSLDQLKAIVTAGFGKLGWTSKTAMHGELRRSLTALRTSRTS